MTNDTRSPDDIERDIFEERERMSASINTLQKKFSVEAIVGDVGDMLRTQGGDLGRMVSQTVGRNPAAVALVGVGLAWLFLGQDRSQSRGKDGAWDDDSWGEGAGSRRNRGSQQSWDRPGGASSGRGERGAWDGSGDGGHSDGSDSWFAQGQMARARSAGRSLGGSTSATGARWDDLEAGSGVTGAVKGAAHAVGDAVSGAAGSVSRAAQDLTDRLSHGLEDLSEEARTRVLAARRAAHDAREASAAAMRTGARAASNFFDDQPLVVGALAVALGAAFGGVLPNSRIEDKAMGASSDQLFADAQALFREERDKAMAALRMAASDVKGEIREAGSELAELLPEGKNVGEVIVDRAAEAASRVYDHAAGGVEHGNDTLRG